MVVVVLSGGAVVGGAVVGPGEVARHRDELRAGRLIDVLLRKTSLRLCLAEQELLHTAEAFRQDCRIFQCMREHHPALPFGDRIAREQECPRRPQAGTPQFPRHEADQQIERLGGTIRLRGLSSPHAG